MEAHFRGHDALDALTSEEPSLHSAATPQGAADPKNGLQTQEQQLQIATFLDALADVALSVAARSLESGNEGEPA